MAVKVSFLRVETVEAEAEKLLAAYGGEHGPITTPPVPVDDILEGRLGLSLDMDDLSRMLGVDDVLGAMWADTREVFVDQSLDPDEHPASEGRYHFTVAHEIGHWQLHRHFFLDNPAQTMLFAEAKPPPTLICRESESKKPIEWQADRFAACLLMPKAMVFDSWREEFGHTEPWVFDEAKRLFSTENGPVYAGRYTATAAFSNVARRFAGEFRVSVQAMRIRLGRLGLLLDGRQRRLFAVEHAK